MTGPDVSVVVISFNDADAGPARHPIRAAADAARAGDHRRGRRVDRRHRRRSCERSRSRTRASGTSGWPRTPAVAARRAIAASSCSRAPWVMFCDSDDEYERHACKNLLQVAERHGADVVCGTAERVDVRHRATPAMAAGGARRRCGWKTVWSPSPSCVYDTISVNKIYRRTMLEEAGIAFPEGLLFEDQLFTMEAFAAAERLAAIPETVYLWYVDRLSDEPSITQRRNEVRNVDSRIEVNRRIDAFLAERGLASIQRIKDLKFLRHDLYLYLSSILEADDDTARELMERLRPYVDTVDLAPALGGAARPARRDLPPARRRPRGRARGDAHRQVGVRGRRTRRPGGWSRAVGVRAPADGPDVAGFDVRDWLDVTDLHLLEVPFTQRRYLHVLDALTVDDGVVTASGSTVDFDGSLGAVDAIELRVLVGGDRTAMAIPATWTSHLGPDLDVARATGAPSPCCHDRWSPRTAARRAGPAPRRARERGERPREPARGPRCGGAVPGRVRPVGPVRACSSPTRTGPSAGGRRRPASWVAAGLRGGRGSRDVRHLQRVLDEALPGAGPARRCRSCRPGRLAVFESDQRPRGVGGASRHQRTPARAASGDPAGVGPPQRLRGRAPVRRSRSSATACDTSGCWSGPGTGSTTGPRP